MCLLHNASALEARDVPECPFTIRRLNETTYLIREHDPYGESPHIYVRICSQTDSKGNQSTVIVVNDTGVNTSAPRNTGDKTWTIKSFLEHHLNPKHEIPYLVILSHCHYDHILGLHSLLSKDDSEDACHVTVLASSHQPSFTDSYEKLAEHSLCNSIDMKPPIYHTAIWAKDWQQINYDHPAGHTMELPIVAIHTPGHTPDSLSWFDTESRTLYVGDSLYQQESNDSQSAPWGRESPAPIMFSNEASIFDWWKSIDKAKDFVQKENTSGKPRVTLAAGHVTVLVDALSCLDKAKVFMARVLRGEVACVSWPERRGRAMGHWTDDADGEGCFGEFSVGAPIFIIEEGRRDLSQEWA
ncbi:hypothetical protein FALBO_652 [Fusarium albosuccineum]|uniref:Metallo-beta-lactamase domain-containing protein n=1 Tax=Fusarium albosuccineum TaxID=1237068 RepID=A0A8H4LMN3_9HYPO|nr:hypothetical protein FALBO_652 [Fusarium albosuccineum]